MNRNVLVLFILTAVLFGSSAYAGQPAFSLGLSDGTIREMDLFLINVAASDTAGHALDYTWSITSDETGGNAFFRSKTHASAEFAVQWQSSSLAGSLNGKKVTIQVVARHANPDDGTEEAVSTATYTVQGVNHPPVAVISGKLGTPTERIPTGYGVCADAYDSDDPDGDTLRGDWGWGSRTGGYWKTPVGDVAPALVGSEGGRCCFTVLDMSAPINQNIELTLTNGLHSIKAVATCYLKPAGAPVQTNSAPVITFPTNPVQVTVGGTAQLVAEVDDANGDPLSYSVVFVQTGATVASSAISVTTISSTKKRVTVTLPCPNAGTFQFRFTATETSTADHKADMETLTVIVGTGGGGGGNPNDPVNGGTPDVTPTDDTCDATETGGPPTITISPDPGAFKPQWESGDSVRIAVVAHDSSSKTWMTQTVRGVASITWDVSGLTSKGITPTIAPTVARPGDLYTSDSSISFTVPTLTTATDVYLTVTAKDVYDCGRSIRFAIRLAPGSASNNQPPVAKIQYKIGSGTYTNAPGTAVPLETATAQTITLKGDTSTDDGGTAGLTYSWVMDKSITAGGATLTPLAGSSTTLSVTAHSKGTVTVTLTAKDAQNATGAATISFNITDPAQKPIARATAKVGTQALTTPVAEGTTVKLDGSASSRPDNSKTGLTYQWTQTEGPEVTITDADKSVATFVAPAPTETATSLKFKLIVSDAGTASDPVELTINLSPPSFYFSQVAVGPLGNRQFRTVLLLVNRNETPATGVKVEFFGQDGNPMEVTINGAAWQGAPFDIPALGAKKLEFSGTDLKAGWAKVNSSLKIVGLLQYQIIGEDAILQTEVGLYATEAATKFATFYDISAETAIAVANTSTSPATVRIRLIDEKNGNEVVTKNLFVLKPGGLLPAMNHDAKFLTKEFLGELPPDFSLGTLLIESSMPVSITVLKTRGGEVFSTLPVASMR